jgi:hypothetical protein
MFLYFLRKNFLTTLDYKMKIAIYGDSYADYRYQPRNNKTWMHYLEDRLNTRVTSFAASGSGLYFSVKKYLETHQEFDKIIFIVTFPGRLYVSQTETDLIHIPGISLANLVSETSDNLHEKKIFSAAADYLLYVQNYEEELFKHYCMLDRINHDDVLIIPVSPDSLENYNGTTLTDISHIDYDYYQIDRNSARKDLRCCHMNQQNNKIFADKIYDWIQMGDFDFKVEDFKYPTESIDEIIDSILYI